MAPRVRRSEKSGQCPFCVAVAGTESPGFARHRARRALLDELNAFSSASGHLTVFPYRHVADLDTMDSGELGDLMALTRRAVRALDDLMTPEGFNVGLNLGSAAGAGVPEHLHLHVVPRWEGDTNFMPVIATTRVLPQALDATRASVAAALARLP